MGYTEGLDIVQLLRKSGIGTPAFIAEAALNGDIRGEIPDMDFINNCILTLLVPFDIGMLEVCRIGSA
ncbi:hypothetical protein D3C75_1305130 [compost metagenome]